MTEIQHRDAVPAAGVDGLLSLPAAQQPRYADPAAVGAVRAELACLDPVTTSAEVDLLGHRLAAVAGGRAFLLQGGDCAERFADRAGGHVAANVRLLIRMAEVIGRAAGVPVVKVGRIAGQYAKPRSAPVDALGLPVYRGDIVNSPLPRSTARAADPRRMLRAREYARATMAEVRELTWPAAGQPADPAAPEVFASHEGLLLDYEAGLLRPVGRSVYCLSTHLLWIGERTRQLDGAHVALAALVANPVGVKIGGGTTPAEVAEYVERLDPECRPGRLTLIARMGHRQVQDVLPPLVERVRATGRAVIWQCDPMHGNTFESPTGYKTRHFDDIVAEIVGFVAVHRGLGTHPGGLHVELTGDPVTECVGGSQRLSDPDLVERYETACDPRLNWSQAMELAQITGELLRPAG